MINFLRVNNFDTVKSSLTKYMKQAIPCLVPCCFVFTSFEANAVPLEMQKGISVLVENDVMNVDSGFFRGRGNRKRRCRPKRNCKPDCKPECKPVCKPCCPKPIRGPTGARGATGATGGTGATGAAGPTGASETSFTLPISSGNPQVISVNADGTSNIAITIGFGNSIAQPYNSIDITQGDEAAVALKTTEVEECGGYLTILSADTGLNAGESYTFRYEMDGGFGTNLETIPGTEIDITSIDENTTFPHFVSFDKIFPPGLRPVIAKLMEYVSVLRVYGTPGSEHEFTVVIDLGIQEKQ